MLSTPVEFTSNVPPLAVTLAALIVMPAELNAVAPTVIAPVCVSDAPVLTLRFPVPMPLIPTLSAPPVVALAELERLSVPVLPLPTLTPEVTFSVVPEPVNVAVAVWLLPTVSVGADMSLPALTVAGALKETVLPLVQVIGWAAARLKLPPVTLSVPVLLNVM